MSKVFYNFEPATTSIHNMDTDTPRFVSLSAYKYAKKTDTPKNQIITSLIIDTQQIKK